MVSFAVISLTKRHIFLISLFFLFRVDWNHSVWCSFVGPVASLTIRLQDADRCRLQLTDVCFQLLYGHFRIYRCKMVLTVYYSILRRIKIRHSIWRRYTLLSFSLRRSNSSKENKDLPYVIPIKYLFLQSFSRLRREPYCGTSCGDGKRQIQAKKTRIQYVGYVILRSSFVNTFLFHQQQSELLFSFRLPSKIS